MTQCPLTPLPSQPRSFRGWSSSPDRRLVSVRRSAGSGAVLGHGSVRLHVLESAASGNGFYTVPGDHLNCPIGSYTHAIDLPAGREAELEQALTLMAGIGYVRMEEVPSIPRLAQSPAFIYYAPLGKAAVAPDVVIAAGRPGPLMRLQEAAARAGAASQLPLLGRPTCMALPAAMAHGRS